MNELEKQYLIADKEKGMLVAQPKPIRKRKLVSDEDITAKKPKKKDRKTSLLKKVNLRIVRKKEKLTRFV